ncbi:hypothetical protein BC835DRAFT_1305189 [Cytidiella melzeri]|nr:hypothetical protein BC835DRAFT_1305189 [Cytidiella melzeri]
MRPLRRSSSRIQRWVTEQQKRQSGGSVDDASEDSEDTDVATPSGSNAHGRHAWLAYPHLSVTKTQATSRQGFTNIDESYVFVEESKDMPSATEDAVTQRAPQQVVDLTTSPETPRKSRLLPTAFTTPSPLRSLARGITQASRPFSVSSSNSTLDQSQTNTSSVFKRQSRASLHTRTSNLAGALFAQRQARETPSDATTIASSTSHWGLKPPSIIMGHFPNTSGSLRAPAPQLPRPSTSSSITRSSETTHTRRSTDTDNSFGQRDSGRGTVRSHTPSNIFQPSSSLWSLPSDASHLNDRPDSTRVLATDRTKTGTSVRIPLVHKPSYSSGFGSSMLHLSKNKKKRKLIVSGITPGDQRRYDRLRQWCEGFGELNQITRMPNGDLHVDFRRTEVADTVCRLHASVHINGVGTVGLSWYTGKRP